jgi:hypothetical protein
MNKNFVILVFILYCSIGYASPGQPREMKFEKLKKN